MSGTLTPLCRLSASEQPGAQSRFSRRLFAEVPALIGSVEAARLLANAHWWNADFANSQLELWQESESRLARQAYGEIVALAFFMQPTARVAADET